MKMRRPQALIFISMFITSIIVIACDYTEESVFAVPAGAQAGDLTMTPCTLDFDGVSLEAECGTLVVPENRSVLDSRLIVLPVRRYRATQSAAADPVFFLFGGPGASNIQPLPPQEWLNNNHDLVAVGYRGVDGSIVLDMPEVNEALKGKGTDLLSAESRDALGAAVAEGAARLQQEGVDLAGYTIPEVVADMEAARIGLGYERINLFSHSYGTRVAQIYSWLHPDSLHRVLMLSANPPGRMVWEPQMADEQLAYYAALCAQDDDCRQRTPDLNATVRHVFENIPPRWGLIPIDPGRVKVLTFLMLSDTFTANLMLDALIAAEQGDYSGLALLSLGYIYQFDVPHSSIWGNTFAIAHSADFDPTRNYKAEMNPADAILGSPYSLLVWSEAENWPYMPMPVDLRQSQSSDVETLVVAGSIDFSTPKEYAVNELMPYLNKGQLVIVSEAGHTGFLEREAAFIRLVTSFYDTGVGDNSLYDYQPMDFSVELPLTQLARQMMRRFVLYPMVVLVTLAVVVSWRNRRRHRCKKGTAFLVADLSPF